MAMVSAPSRVQALSKMDLPGPQYFNRENLNRERMIDMLLVESDGEWWFNPESVTKQLRLDGLTEAQVNVKLCTGHSHCPKCNSDLSTIGFFDFFIDNVRIQQAFACKKCRHQWGGPCSGPKDFSLTPVAAPERAERVERGPSAPRASAGTKSIKDSLFIEVQQTHSLSDWEAFRTEYIKQCVAAGIKLSTATAAASKRRRLIGSG